MNRTDRFVHALVGISGSSLALGLLIWGIGGAVGAFGCGWFIDRIGAGYTSALGIAVLAVALAVLGLSGSAVIVLVAMFFAGVGSWSFVAPNNHMLTGLHPKMAGVVISFNSTGTYVGQALGAAIGGGLLTGGFGATRTVLVAVGGLVAAIILALIASRATAAR